MSPDLTKLIIIITGLLLGVVFGVVLLLSGGWGALLVTALGLIGAGLAWLVHALVTGRLDFSAAWNALLRR